MFYEPKGEDTLKVIPGIEANMWSYFLYLFFHRQIWNAQLHNFFYCLYLASSSKARMQWQGVPRQWTLAVRGPNHICCSSLFISCVYILHTDYKKKHLFFHRLLYFIYKLISSFGFKVEWLNTLLWRGYTHFFYLSTIGSYRKSP